ncbi:MAG TPA: hypothetical protein VGM26_03765 [Rhizomicrobium sp.]|jgi:hypothetical protein
MAMPFYSQYCLLVSEIERRYAVAQWKQRDVDIWPLARMSLYLDMYWANAGGPPVKPHRWPPLQIVARLMRPLINIWRSRYDLAHFCLWPKRRHAIFLGDGVCLDLVSRSWRDRIAEPLIVALGRRGQESFLMQGGGFSRLPYLRPTFAANIAQGWGDLIASLLPRRAHLPEHEDVVRFLAENGVAAPSLRRTGLEDCAAQTDGAAMVFMWILGIVRPDIAFVTRYFTGLGPAFVLACRRRGILSVDLQCAPLQGAPMAYVWDSVPSHNLVPDMFWLWTQADVESVEHWANGRAFHGGYIPQADVAAPNVLDEGFDKEILIALQPVAGCRDIWEALADAVDDSQANWRWWIRRHPASTPAQDEEFGRLLSLRRPGVMMTKASEPLSQLLHRMHAVVSLGSGTAVEAAMFGVPSLFLSPAAQMPFGDLIASGAARVIDVRMINDVIATLNSTSNLAPEPPDLDSALAYLESLANAHRVTT